MSSQRRWMRPPVLAACAALVAVLAARVALADTAADERFQEIFTRANKATLDGEYDKAIGEYQKLIQAGLVHPDLYFNLANAYYRANRKGLAVLFYEKALAIDPSDAAAQSNLAMVRKELIDKVVMPEGGAVGVPLWHGFIRGLSPGWLTWTFLVLYGLLFASMIGRRLTASRPLKRLLFWINVPLISVVCVFGFLLGSRIYIQKRVHHAVVIAPTANLREGPERTAEVTLEVHEGLKVLLLTEVGDHVRVRLANGVEGFLLNSQLGRI
ncbi:MAG: tetratricopeptide repeat protein [Deltaproteobacteria bacterium]|nr:tetratricopeptide repeat protein [Deltaproteobacteria bacterium]